MKIVCISDTHSKHWDMKHKLPTGNVLIHAGDMTPVGQLQQIGEFGQWLEEKKPYYDHIIVVAGNHDITFERHPVAAINCLPSWVNYLHDSDIVIDGIKFYGAPYSSEFHPERWAFNTPRNHPRTADLWSIIPDDVDVLITHGPPYGYGDYCPDFDKPGYNIHVGCELLRDRVAQIQPRLHVCGHIHEDQGLFLTNYGTLVANASICNGAYRPDNPPIVVNI